MHARRHVHMRFIIFNFQTITETRERVRRCEYQINKYKWMREKENKRVISPRAECMRQFHWNATEFA